MGYVIFLVITMIVVGLMITLRSGSGANYDGGLPWFPYWTFGGPHNLPHDSTQGHSSEDPPQHHVDSPQDGGDAGGSFFGGLFDGGIFGGGGDDGGGGFDGDGGGDGGGGGD